MIPPSTPPRAWLLLSLAAAPWLFWTCPPCWVLALLSPAAPRDADGGTADGRSAF